MVNILENEYGINAAELNNVCQYLKRLICLFCQVHQNL